MSPMMHTAPEALIDGTKHPELISDATAYRLVFVVLGLAPDATADEQMARTLRLQNVGLSDTDVNEAIVVLDTFKNQYADLIQTFNTSASALIASGSTPDLQSFDARRDALVQSTRGELRRVLSSNGIVAFNNFVQQEKRNMKAPKDAP